MWNLLIALTVVTIGVFIAVAAYYASRSLIDMFLFWWRDRKVKKQKGMYTSDRRYCPECGKITEHADGGDLGWLCLDYNHPPDPIHPSMYQPMQVELKYTIQSEEPKRYKYPKEKKQEEPKHHTRELMLT